VLASYVASSSCPTIFLCQGHRIELKAMNVLFTLLISLLVWNSVADSDSDDGGRCTKDSDCPGNLDCIRLGFRKQCVPVTCAKGAAQAMIDNGFDAPNYIARLRGKTGLRGSTDFVALAQSDESSTTLLVKQAFVDYPPPMEVYNSNFTACLRPQDPQNPQDPQDTNLLSRQGGPYIPTNTSRLQATAWTGLSWTASAIFDYHGKLTSFADPERDFSRSLFSNCVGARAGAKFGVDFLIQSFCVNEVCFEEEPTENARNYNNTPTDPRPVTIDPGNTVFVPILTCGPFSLSVGYFASNFTMGTITEISFGASLGASLGGFNYCFNSLTSTSTFEG
jgi:hypothetical protein